jgi:hypothetical protein
MDWDAMGAAWARRDLRPRWATLDPWMRAMARLRHGLCRCRCVAAGGGRRRRRRRRRRGRRRGGSGACPDAARAARQSLQQSVSGGHTPRQRNAALTRCGPAHDARRQRARRAPFRHIQPQPAPVTPAPVPVPVPPEASPSLLRHIAGVRHHNRCSPSSAGRGLWKRASDGQPTSQRALPPLAPRESRLLSFVPSAGR